MRNSYALTLVISLLIQSSFCVLFSENQSATGNEKIIEIAPNETWTVNNENLPTGSYYKLALVSGSGTVEHKVNGEQINPPIPITSNTVITQYGNDEYIITNVTNIPLVLKYTEEHPNGSPVLYASICIQITAFIGFLLFYNGRIAKLD